ncbi:MAG TPA: glycohydrolase toxin TNT-related protein [Acinetobacter towneri]|nr:glycohydrolase toxin TNT-related protein [Acinetobacter towneri]
MNKNCYRIIFSQARGMFVAVAEIVKSRSKTAGQTEAINTEDASQFTPQTLKKLNPLNFAVVSLLGAVVYTVPFNSIANTQIIADKSAPSSQQATILNSSNGLTQVNIQTPSTGGVSRNTYKQFDVSQEGAILNNSRNNVQTQLGGWVQGNPWLGKGEAKVILNEVNSSNPSQLKGYLEVAGKSAQVVIANPSGLVCDGCGVINADRFSLAAGQAVVNQGYLESFRVRDGQVTIAGKGLNGSLTPYTDIYARALNVNAGLYANELTTVLGQNDINVKDQTAPQVQAVSSQSSTQTSKPDFALDVAQLGGMYAGKIFLVGTEQGLGVRNAGSINTTAAQMTLNANGDLVNSGNIIANKGALDVQAKNIANSGNISSAASQVVMQSQTLDNSGTISSADELKLQQKNIQNMGLINAARVAIDADSLSNSGKIQQTGTQALKLQADKISNTAGKIGVIATASPGGTGSTSGTTDPVAEQPVNQAQDGGSLNVTDSSDLPVKTYESGYLHVKNLNNDSGSIEANGGIDVTSQSGLNNDHGKMALGRLTLSGAELNNQSGQLSVREADIQTDTINNQKGQLYASQSLKAKAQVLNNQSGSIHAVDLLDLNSTSTHNAQGEIASQQQLSLNGKSIDNNSGAIFSEQGIVIINASSQLNNTHGQIQAKQQLTVQTAQLSNMQGQLNAQTLSLKSKNIQNAQGLLQAEGSLTIDADGGILNNQNSGAQGGILAKQDISIQNAAEIQNQQGLIGSQKGTDLQSAQLQNQQGQILSGTDLNIQAQLVQNQTGVMQSGNDLKIKADRLNNSASTTQGSHISAGTNLTIQALEVDNRGTKTTQSQGLDAKTIQLEAQSLNNTQGALRAEQLAKLNIENDLNNQKGLISSQHSADISGEQLKLDNSQGLIAAQDSLKLTTSADLENAGQLVSLKDAEIQAKNIRNAQGAEIFADNNLKLQASVIENSGSLTAGQRLSSNSESLLNTAIGQILASHVQLKATDRILNQGLINADWTELRTNTLTNQGARIYGTDVSIQADTLNNEADAVGKAAVLASRQNMHLGVQQLNNKANVQDYDSRNIISSGRDLVIGGELNTQGQAIGEAVYIYNGSSLIEAQNDLFIYTKELLNRSENFDVVPVLDSTQHVYGYQNRNTGEIIPLEDIVKTHYRGHKNDILVLTLKNGDTLDVFNRFEYDEKIYVPKVITNTPAQIVSGHNLLIDASSEISNDQSQILAGNILHLENAQIDHIERPSVETTIFENAKKQYYKIIKKKRNAFGGHYEARGKDTLAYAPEPENKPIFIDEAENGSNKVIKYSTEAEQVQQAGKDLSGALNTDATAAKTQHSDTSVSLQKTDNEQIRAMSDEAFKVPNNALYSVNPDSKASYWVETDPTYANYQNWLSSDFMIKALGLDPANMQKRIGDGYYEQRLVQDQIAQLTGFRYLSGYESNETQYKALMNNGLSFAKQFNLTAGVALTAAQIAQLTTDIVWLEEKTVRLPNGESVKALVPAVYVRSREGDLTGDGSLIAAEKVSIISKGDVLSSATIAGRQAVDLKAANLELLNGRIQSNEVSLQTDKNTVLQGGQIKAGQSLSIDAGENLTLATNTEKSENAIGKNYFAKETVGRVAGLYVGQASGQNSDTENLSTTVVLRSGGNTQLNGAQIINAKGATQIAAQGDVNLDTLQLSKIEKSYNDSKHFLNDSRTEELGTQIQSQGNVLVQGQDISARAVNIDSKNGTTALLAKNDLNISEGRTSLDYEAMDYEKSRGLLSKKSTQTYVANQQNTAVASNITGKNIVLDAGRDIAVQGSQIKADDAAHITAGNNINIVAAKNQSAQQSEVIKKKSGFSASLSDGVASVGYGKSNANIQQENTAETLTQSVISSGQGNTVIAAAKDLTTEAALIQSAKDLTLQGQNVNLNAGTASSNQQMQAQSKNSGLSVGITYNPIEAAVSAYKKSSDNTEFSDSAVGQVMSQAEALNKAAQAATTFVVVAGGSQKSTQNSNYSTTQAVVTQAEAQGNLNIIATEVSIRSQGAQLSAEGDALLHAKDTIHLSYATDTESQTSSSKQSGFSIDNRDKFAPAGVYNNKNQGTGSIDSVTGTQLSAGGQSTLKTTQGDVNMIASSLVSEGDVNLLAARDVNILSAQNTKAQSESSSNKGVGSAQISDTEQFFGYMKGKSQSSSNDIEQQRSQVGSLGGNVNVQAGNEYLQQSADLVAKQDVNIDAKSIQVLENHNSGSASQSSKDLKVGIFKRISSPILDLLGSADKAAKSKADDRTQALQAVAAGAQAYQSYSDIQSGALVKAEAGIGFSTNSNQQNSSYANSQENKITAGRDVNLSTTAGDIHLQNMQVTANDAIRLNSAKDIILESGQSQAKAEGKNSNAGASIGYGVSVGAQTGAYIYAEVGYGKGSNHSNSNTHTQTVLNAENISLNSKADTTLQGAKAEANRIDADVGGNLNIISQQDTLDQNSKQMGVGARVQVSAGTAWDASGNFNNSSAKGISKQVNQQSGLFAGDGGYHVKADHVDLQGGAITSTASKENNDLTANSLKFSNIENESSHNATTVALSGGTRFGEEKGADSTGAEYTSNVNWRDSTSFSPTLPQQDKDSDSSTTYATISAGNINIGGKETSVEELGIHSDINTANQIVADVPDLQAILDKQKIVSDATSTVVAATRIYSQNKQAEAEAQKQSAEQQAIAELQAKGGEDWAKYNSTDDYVTKQNLLKSTFPAYKEVSDQAQTWGMGGNSSRALNAVTTAITAALGGQTDLQVVTNTLAPYAAQVIGGQFGHGEDKNTAAQLVSHAILGATLAYINGGDPTAGGSAAIASEAAANYLTNQLAENYKDDPKYFVNGEFQANLLSEAEKAQIRDLTAGIGAVIGGAVGDSTYNAQLAGVIGQNAVENNGFSIIDENYGKVVKENTKVKFSCPTGYICPIPEKNLSEKTLLVINDLTIRQLAAAMGAEYDPITKEHLTPKEIQDAKVAMLGLGFSKTLSGPIKLTDEAIENIGKKYGKNLLDKITNTRNDIPTASQISKVDLNANIDDGMQYIQYQNLNGGSNKWGWIWPENLGFKGEKIESTLKVGTKLDRVGEPTGSFLAPAGTSYEARALAPGSASAKVYHYEVIKPLPIIKGEIAPAFGQKGGGIQILPNVGQRVNVQWLIEKGYIKEIK